MIRRLCRAFASLALAWAAAAPLFGADHFDRLKANPSPEATRRLRSLYESSKSRDVRFWIVQALGNRLRENADAGALEVLLSAALDREPEIRGSALRAMAGFAALAKGELHGAALARLDSAVLRGRSDKSPPVRLGAEELGGALRRYRDKGPRAPDKGRAPARPLEARRALTWAWTATLAAVLAGWALLGLPVFDAAAGGGQLARSAWAALSGERAFIAFLGVLWVCLALTLAGHGFDQLLRIGGRGLGHGSGDWLRAYFAAGFCVVAPGVVACAGLTSGRFRWETFLRDLPRAAALSAAVLAVLGPAELVYRLLLRRAPARSRALRRIGPRAILEAGSVRCACLASAAMSIEGHGLLPALGRAARISRRFPPRLGFSVFDSRFTLCFAAPVLGGLYLLFARALALDWTAPRPLTVAACALWAWAVLAAVLFAVLQALDGVLCAAGYLAASGRPLPHRLAPLAKYFGGVP
ncbi:MAG: hypothetical protein HY922_06395 [Elusimicrobia bacterium]|nr:hypothetical protein [Elusimicrobiota bacterium]